MGGMGGVLDDPRMGGVIGGLIPRAPGGVSGDLTGGAAPAGYERICQAVG